MALRCGQDVEVVDGGREDDVHWVVGRAMEASVWNIQVPGGYLVVTEQGCLQHNKQVISPCLQV